MDMNNEKMIEYEVPKPKFKIGQLVYMIGKTRSWLKIVSNCKVCNGFGFIKLKGFSDKIKCPTCNLFDSSKYIEYTRYQFVGTACIKNIHIHVYDDGKANISYDLSLDHCRPYNEYELFPSYEELKKTAEELTKESREKAELLYSEYKALPEVYSASDLLEYEIVKNKEGETDEN